MRCPATTFGRVLQLEFTVEPFVEGLPGPHVTAAVQAVERAGGFVEFGPFGSTCSAAADDMPHVIAELVRAAFANGASHVTMHVADSAGSAGSAGSPESSGPESEWEPGS